MGPTVEAGEIGCKRAGCHNVHLTHSRLSLTVGRNGSHRSRDVDSFGSEAEVFSLRRTRRAKCKQGKYESYGIPQSGKEFSARLRRTDTIEGGARESNQREWGSCGSIGERTNSARKSEEGPRTDDPSCFRGPRARQKKALHAAVPPGKRASVNI